MRYPYYCRHLDANNVAAAVYHAYDDYIYEKLLLSM